MTRILAYCAFLRRDGISLPDSGVRGEAVEEIEQGDLGLLWSEVEWPFDPATLQRSAIEFHRVVVHMFSQGAVVPFRLLSVFDDRQSLVDFIAAHESSFVADLERLQNLVQMECVLYASPPPRHAQNRRASGTPAPGAIAGNSGRDYLEQKAAALHGVEAFIQTMKTALGSLSRQIRVRESKKGSRIFVLVERGHEEQFHSIVRQLPASEGLARRTSGPWPPAEFLSDSVKAPQIAGQR